LSNAHTHSSTAVDPSTLALRVVHHIDTPNFAGTERSILELSLAQREQGHHVRIACPRDSALAARARKMELQVLAVPSESAFNAPAVRLFRRLLREGSAHVLHAHNGRSALSCALAVRLARRGVCVATQHFIHPAHVGRGGVAGRVFRGVHHAVNFNTQHLIACAGASREAMLQRGDAPPEKISIIPLGISPLQATLAPDAVRAALNVDEKAPLVVCVARLEREKDVASLVAAMKIVSRQLRDAVCVVAGEGALRGDLETSIRVAELEGTVRLLGFHDDVASLMAAADVFVLPSLEEPFGLVLLEAMALGRPVVSTRAGGPIEIVADGQTGVLVPPQSPGELAGALLKLLSDKSLREGMGREGLRRYQESFTPTRMAKQTLDLYHQTLKMS